MFTGRVIFKRLLNGNVSIFQKKGNQFCLISIAITIWIQLVFAAVISNRTTRLLPIRFSYGFAKRLRPSKSERILRRRK